MARKPLYRRVSQEERRQDTTAVLQRLLQLLDESFDRSENAAEIILSLNSPTDIADRYLKLFGNTLKYNWNTEKSYLWNRAKIEEAIDRYSCKGSTDSIEDLLREYGAQWWRITDMASRLDIWNRQGGWNSPNGVVMDANRWHEGSFLLEVDEFLDFDGFLADFQDIRRAGTYWFFNRHIPAIIGDLVTDGDTRLSADQTSMAKEWTGLYWNWFPCSAGGDRIQKTDVAHLYSMRLPWDENYWNEDFVAGGIEFTTFPVRHLVSENRPWKVNFWNWETTSGYRLDVPRLDLIGSESGVLFTADTTIPVAPLDLPASTIYLTEPYDLMQPPIIITSEVS